MKRISIAVVPLFALALALPAYGQGKNLTADTEDTVKVGVNGGIDLDYVFRSKELDFFTSGFPGGNLGNDETTVEGQMYVGLNIELNDKISGQFEVGTRGVDDGFTSYYGQTGFPTVVISHGIRVREANVRISEFLSPELSLQLGMTTWSFDVRGKGSSFAFDPRNSGSITKNFGTGQGTDAGMLGGNQLDVLDTYGAVGTYSSNQIQLDVVLLPAVIEGGPANGDEALYAVDFFYTFDEASGSRFAAILALSNHAGGGGITGTGSQIITVGAGVTLNNLVENMELYGEVYFQFGDVGEIGTTSIDAGGIAGQIGLEYSFGGPFLGVNITYVSGDGDTPADNSSDAFSAYENINDLAILEDMWWGLDVDSNYIALKINGGFVFSFAGGQDNFTLEGIIGVVTAAEDVTGTGSGANEDGVGNEIDVKATWALNSQFNLHAAIAYLIGSDLLEESMGGSGVPDAEDSATLFYIGFGFGF